MGRAPCCDKANVKKGPWSPEEDAKLKDYIEKHGTGGNWIALPQKVGLKRCGKSCRLRWLNYLRPNIKHGEFSDEEDRVIINLFANIGSRWSIIAAQLPGRTDNDIKNYWNTKLKKKLMGIINNQSPSQNQSQLRKLPIINTTSSTNISSSSSYLLQPSSSSYGSLITNYSSFEPNNNISAFASMNLQVLPQESFLGQMQYYNNQQLVKDTTSFSCSSSDGSQYGRDHSSSDQFDHINNFHGSASVEEKPVNINNNMVSSSNGSGNVSVSDVNNSWGTGNSSQSSAATDHHHQVSDNSVLDYGLEEIKQLISSTNSSTNSSCSNNFLFDENKTDQERVLYYYY